MENINLERGASHVALLQACVTESKDVGLHARLGQTCKSAWQVVSDPTFVAKEAQALSSQYPWVRYALQRHLLEKPTLKSIVQWISLQHYIEDCDKEENLQDDSLNGFEDEESQDSGSDSDSDDLTEVGGAATEASTRLTLQDWPFLRHKAVTKLCSNEMIADKKKVPEPTLAPGASKVQILQACASHCIDVALQAHLGLTCRSAWAVVDDPCYMAGELPKLEAAFPWVKFAKNRGLLQKPTISMVHKWVAVEHFVGVECQADDSSADECT
mmetsp:Transcript_26168/g.60596  ORF Transcript_26168/g.60596 Transcript_26168/m.60596 type:complete len:271 (-) Transcript_26168:57-869(-)